jgi:uncharacterized protein (TIGR00255 family)
MTGFGREQRIINGREITVEIRAVNHRYHEFTARVPRQYTYLEEKLKTLVGKSANRGKVEVTVMIHSVTGKEVEVNVNRPVVESYLNALEELRLELPFHGEINISDVFRIPDAFTIVKSIVDEDEIWEAVGEVAAAALARFVAMREAEGGRLKADILERLAFIETQTAQIEVVSPESTEKYRNKLSERMKEVVSGCTDEQRILFEAAIFAEKTAVDEETVRLKSHVAGARDLLDTESVVGRKLDFLVQEMNREINTIGSKAHEITITRMVVDLKSELEKIREQIQNIE